MKGNLNTVAKGCVYLSQKARRPKIWLRQKGGGGASCQNLGIPGIEYL
jgi:hypothetical protein